MSQTTDGSPLKVCNRPAIYCIIPQGTAVYDGFYACADHLQDLFCLGDTVYTIDVGFASCCYSEPDLPLRPLNK